ncbi:choice-of-anchor Q domain-containing protein [Niastella sp. OAS944]|uniref:choice-of-anchor Q domain-containing protein n=1 Tax=Niastella sp. OAS944 TaxID=2664089 RepID=UPI0035C7D3FC|nr:hypothetical protein [Chitinophagaceae bacterium OAS944]
MKANYTPTPFVFLITILLTITQTASATIRYVSQWGTGGGTSWGNASGDLKAMIDASQPGDEVWILEGTYQTPDNQSIVMRPGVKIYGGFYGGETSPAQRDLLNHETRLYPYDNEVLIQNINNGLTSTALLDGFILTDAVQSAVINQNSSPAFTNCTFENNSTSSSGGAMKNTGSSPTITNCLFRWNTAGDMGGAIYNYQNSSPLLTACTFTSNEADYGGGMANDFRSSPTLNNCLFNENKVINGGGIFITTNCAPVLNSCTFNENEASIGAGIYSSDASPVLTNCTFTTNYVNNYGGGIYSKNSAITLYNCTIRSNSATYGGGLYCESSTCHVVNCLLSGNSASYAGGGAYTRGYYVSFTNCTITSNSATSLGGAMYNNTTTNLFIRNSIIYNNNSGISNNLTTPAISNSLVQGLTATTNGNISGTTNPLFVAPVPPNSGIDAHLAADYHLQACSPLVNKGSNNFYAVGQSPDLSAITTDLDGNARFYNGSAADMGCYERTGEPTISATNGIIYVKANGTGTGESWACATGDLQAAINGAVSGNQVWVAGGIYIPNRRSDATGVITVGDRNNAFVLKNDVKIYGGFAGTETSLTDRNLSLTANASILSGDLSSNDNGFTNNGENAIHVVVSSGNNSATLLDGFTIQGGNCDNSGGAGIACNNSLAVFNNLIVKGNAGRYGAGLNISSSSPTITNSIITGNAGFYGGGIIGSNCGAIITNVIISGNTAVEQGGGMYNEWSVAPVLTNVTIAGNSTQYGPGGAMYNNLGPALQLRNCIVYGNSSGIYNNAGTPNIQYSLVQGEASTANGNINGSTNPLFVNQPAAGLNTGGDFRLQACSPGINAGSSSVYSVGQTPNLSAVTTDLNKAARTQGTTVDMGVYEFTGNYNGNPGATDLLGVNNDAASTPISGITNCIASNTDCRLIATLQSTNDPYNPLNGNVNTKVWIESSQPSDYVKRHYEIYTVNNRRYAVGKATLYFTQAEFDDFNAVNTIKLPTGPGDALGKGNLVIYQYKGNSSDGTGQPNTFTPGDQSTINPANNAIIWNATKARWEVTFDFTGTNGFFVSSEIDVLPLTLLNFNGHTYNGYNQLQWETADEVNTSHFILERSTNGNTYASVATIPAGNNVYSYKDYNSFNGKIYYRLKMVDKDGQFTYSTIVTLNNNGTGSVSIYPNPANDKVYLNTGSELLQQSARLYDVSGQLLQTIQIRNTLQPIYVQHLKSGLYLLQFDNGTTVKFVKK